MENDNEAQILLQTETNDKLDDLSKTGEASLSLLGDILEALKDNDKTLEALIVKEDKDIVMTDSSHLAQSLKELNSSIKEIVSKQQENWNVTLTIE